MPSDAVRARRPNPTALRRPLAPTPCWRRSATRARRPAPALRSRRCSCMAARAAAVGFLGLSLLIWMLAPSAPKTPAGSRADASTPTAPARPTAPPSAGHSGGSHADADHGTADRAASGVTSDIGVDPDADGSALDAAATAGRRARGAAAAGIRTCRALASDGSAAPPPSPAPSPAPTRNDASRASAPTAPAPRPVEPIPPRAAASRRAPAPAPAPPPPVAPAPPPEDHFRLALYYQRVGDFDSALAQYRTLLEQNDASAEVHNNLGLLYRDQGQLDDAIKQFQRAIAIDPTSVKAHNNLGVALMGSNRLDAAAAEFRVALAADSRNVESIVNLALAQKAAGRLADARDLLRAGAGHRSAQRGRPLQPRRGRRRRRRRRDGDRALPQLSPLRRRDPRGSGHAASALGCPHSADRPPVAGRKRRAEVRYPSGRGRSEQRRDRRPPERRSHPRPLRRVPRQRRRPRRSSLRRSGPRPRRLLGAICRRAGVVHAVDPRARLAAAPREVVRRRPDQRQRELPRPPRARAAPQQGRAHLGRRAGRPPHADLLRSLPPGVGVRQRPQVAWREEGRSRGPLPAADSRTRHRDARVRPHRRRAQRDLRRLQRGIGARSHQRCAVPPAGDGRRRLPPRPDRRRSSRSPTRRSRTRRRSST